jgi:desulfoferrodoxin (superoxide reductase-like protein)
MGNFNNQDKQEHKEIRKIIFENIIQHIMSYMIMQHFINWMQYVRNKETVNMLETIEYDLPVFKVDFQQDINKRSDHINFTYWKKKEDVKQSEKL